MPQVQLPIFPAGSVEINRELVCGVEGEQVVYFLDEVGYRVDSAQAAVELLRDQESAALASTLSERSLADSQAEMGYGTTRPLERVVASCGLLSSAELEFVAADDVPNGGVLCALPASFGRRASVPHAQLLQAAAGVLPLGVDLFGPGTFGSGALPFAGAEPLPLPRGVG